MLFFKKKKPNAPLARPVEVQKKPLLAPPVQERVLTAEGWKRRRASKKK